jgi:hypothetical protein
VAGDDGSESLIVFRKHRHYDIGFGTSRESSEAAQIAENRDDLTPLPVQHPFIGLLNQFRHLWRKESFQPVDTLGFFLGDREFLRHVVEPICQLLQFVAA